MERRMNIFLRSLAATSAILLAGVPAMASDHEWNVYANVRFGYSICYPADLLTAQPEADNGDGRAFSGKLGAELRVWGGYNVLEQDLDTIVAGLAGRNAVVSYRRTGKSWAVISGKENDAVFYAKVLLERNAARGIDTVRALHLTYPADEARTYDAVADRLAKCFRPTGQGIDDGLQPSPSGSP